jgi:hypothetical protein
MNLKISYPELLTLIEALSQYVDNAETDDDGVEVLEPHVMPLLNRLINDRLETL